MTTPWRGTEKWKVQIGYTTQSSFAKGYLGPVTLVSTGAEKVMRCLPSVGLKTDMPFWVSKAVFFQYFDQADFLCREVRDVVDAYLQEWFRTDAEGNKCFSLPPVSVNSGSTQFISGRHRTAVLLKHLDQVPLSFDFRFISNADKSWVKSVIKEPIQLGREIELPDLPIRDVLP